MDTPYIPNTFCHFCGTKHTTDSWPRQCGNCQQISYINPIPVAVLLAPVEGDRIVLVHRAIRPFGLAMPGGFVDGTQDSAGNMEDWKDAAARELREETGIQVPADTNIRLVDVRSAGRTVLIFGVLDRPLTEQQISELDELTTPEETESVRIAALHDISNWSKEIIFPLHREVIVTHYASYMR
jgi:ADP-ribose pyrophosphatase YjhB (NUDIX family)